MIMNDERFIIAGKHYSNVHLQILIVGQFSMSSMILIAHILVDQIVDYFWKVYNMT